MTFIRKKLFIEDVTDTKTPEEELSTEVLDSAGENLANDSSAAKAIDSGIAISSGGTPEEAEEFSSETSPETETESSDEFNINFNNQSSDKSQALKEEDYSIIYDIKDIISVLTEYIQMDTVLEIEDELNQRYPDGKVDQAGIDELIQDSRESFDDETVEEIKNKIERLHDINILKTILNQLVNNEILRDLDVIIDDPYADEGDWNG